MIFYIAAAVLAALKLAGLAAPVSWWLIVGIALVPTAIYAVTLLGVLVGMGTFLLFKSVRRL